jgi:hypothetical protein
VQVRRGGGTCQRAAVGSPKNCVNAIPTTILVRFGLGERERRGKPLGAQDRPSRAGEGGWRRGAARWRRRAIARMRRRGKEGGTAGGDAYHHTKLLWCLLDGGRRWSGGASVKPSLTKVAARAS